MSKSLAAMHLKYRRLWLTLGWLMVGVVFFGSLASLGDLPMPQVDHIDKLFHFAGYAWLMGWFAQLYWNQAQRIFIASGLVAMGVTIEFLQALTPDRQFEVADMLANTTGVLLAWLMARGRLQELLHYFETAW